MESPKTSSLDPPPEESADDRSRFDAWAKTMPHLLRNPLYHWTHLELTRYFGITDLLCPKTADHIWDIGKERLAQPNMGARGLVAQSNVKLICTTDDPTDSLEHHRKIAADPEVSFQVLPTWRPDKVLTVDVPTIFNPWIDSLGQVSGHEVTSYESLLDALKERHTFFHENGCRLADHGIDTFYADPYTSGQLENVFQKARTGHAPDPTDLRAWRSALLYELGILNHSRNWVQQFHFGPMRNNSTRILNRVGTDAGCDSMNDLSHALPMSRYLDSLDKTDQLAKTILYNLNPADNNMVGSMIGNFQDGTIPGKIQMGSAWWFGDTLDGMESQIEVLSSLGLLSRFVGMLTDSRSYLSFTRHEYFRRILCNLLGSDVARGRLPNDIPMVGAMVKSVSSQNIERYLSEAS